ncbi:MAG: hypothetical protein KDC98_23180 [Planctomycetes bacterium]|nr:hypothetical protein [Planctomycetota bacterium]
MINALLVLVTLHASTPSPQAPPRGYELHACWNLAARVAVSDRALNSCVDVREAELAAILGDAIRETAMFETIEGASGGLLGQRHASNRWRADRAAVEQRIAEKVGARGAQLFRLGLAVTDGDGASVRELSTALGLTAAWRDRLAQLAVSRDRSEYRIDGKPALGDTVLEGMRALDSELMVQSAPAESGGAWTPNDDKGQTDTEARAASNVTLARVRAMIGDRVVLRLHARPVWLASSLVGGRGFPAGFAPLGDPFERVVSAGDLPATNILDASHTPPRFDVLLGADGPVWTRLDDIAYAEQVATRKRRRLANPFNANLEEHDRLAELSRWYQTFVVPNGLFETRIPSAEGPPIRLRFHAANQTLQQLVIGGNAAEMRALTARLRRGCFLEISARVGEVRPLDRSSEKNLVIVDVLPSAVHVGGK